MCQNAVKKACKKGHIPKQDCEVAQHADFKHAVTRHVLHLIDHGAECSLGGSMKFSNNRCHCKNEWTAANGEVMKWPNNCGDPGGAKGFDYCETFAEEGCVGTGESMAWDRCDRPQKPRYHLGEFAQTAIGKITPVDHYLCVCVDKNANNEMCVAAVKAGCEVGHIPAAACAASFHNDNHAAVSDAVVQLIAKGARCHNIDMALESPSHVPANYITSGCGHGVQSGNGCSCDAGFAGSRCDLCANGYVGYPSCVLKRDCSPVCKYGDCDFTTGTCSCPHNRAGEVCDECASGFIGENCEPAGLLSPASKTGKFFIFVIIVGGLSYLCCCTKPGGECVRRLPFQRATIPGGSYSPLNTDMGNDSEFFDNMHESSDHGMLEVEGQDLAGTDFTPEASSIPPIHRTGLAI
jgi:hypothetical protein